MNKEAHGSPGSHPHADRPNWQPATTPEDYLRNCRVGLEEYSERRAAKLFGVSRAELWRWKLLADLPEDLFERLLAADVLSTKGLAAVAHALKAMDNVAEVERCPHCGEVLRVRKHISGRAAKVVREWAMEQRQKTTQQDVTADVGLGVRS